MSVVFALGATVLWGYRKGVVRYVSPEAPDHSRWYGVELDDPVGHCDGTLQDKRLFQCADKHGIFVQDSALTPYSEEVKSTKMVETVQRGVEARKHLHHSPSTTSSVTFGDTAQEVRAALVIQRAVRGMVGRWEFRRKRMWDAWHVLDSKDESEQVHRHDKYEELKERFEQKQSKSYMPQNQGVTPTVIEDDDTPRLPKDGIDLDFITAMMDHFKHDKLLRRDDVISIVQRLKPVFMQMPNIVNVRIHTRLTVVGDLHGQLDDLYSIFKLNGLPGLRNSYLFNGDFVDRGQFSLECLLVLLCFKLQYPDNVFLNRGNHEARDINSRDGFERECVHKYDLGIFDVVSDLFQYLPLAHIINEKIFVVHGGLFWEDVTLDQILQVDRFHEIPPINSIMEQMLWSDPDDRIQGRADNPRGASLVFGGDVVDRFLESNKLAMIVRSHECHEAGYKKMFGDKLVTVFSASNYCGVVGNQGSFCIFEKDLRYEIVQYAAKAKEKMARYRMRHTAIENDVISKLLRRIAQNRLALVDYYNKLDDARDGTVTRLQWAEGLKKVLGLDIPFLEFQSYLGLPKLGVTGQEQGRVDYLAFLDRYRIHLQGQSLSPQSSAAMARDELNCAMDELCTLMFQNRFELESLFRYFDVNGDGLISPGELRDGILSLSSMLRRPLTDNEVNKLIVYFDKNNDGSIEYDEFANSFKLADPNLAKLVENTEAGKKARAVEIDFRPNTGPEVLANAAPA